MGTETDDGIKVDSQTGAAIALALINQYIKVEHFYADFDPEDFDLGEFQRYLQAIAGDVTVDEESAL